MTNGAFDVNACVPELRAERKERDDFSRSYPQSSIPSEERDGLGSLDCFDPDPDYRVTASVKIHVGPEPATTDISTDGEVRYLRVATFHFELRGTGLALGAYHQEHDDLPTLFVLFRDKTTGQQTHNGGRYMGFMPDASLDELGKVVVDFNPVYNPFCTFTEVFERPLPPEEN